MRPVVSSILRFRSHPGVILVFDEVDPDLCVQGDWDRISQIWLNLLSNAIKFTSERERFISVLRKKGG